MAGTCEISSTMLQKDELQTFVDNARRSRWFAQTHNRIDDLTVKTNELPVLSGYEVPQGGQIEFYHRFIQPDDAIRRAFTSLLAMKDDLFSITCSFDVNDSGQVFDVKDKSDVVLAIGCDVFGFVIGCLTGAASLGRDDLDYRRQLFNRFLQFTGCNSRLAVEYEEGELVPFQFNEFYFAGFVCCGT